MEMLTGMRADGSVTRLQPLEGDHFIAPIETAPVYLT